MSQRRQCGLTQATKLLGSLLLVLGVGALWGARPTEAEWLPAVDAPAAGDHVLVAFKSQAPFAVRATTVRRFGLSLSGGVQSPYFARLSLSEAQVAAGVSVQAVAAALRQDPAVRLAEPDYYRSADSTFPNDPRFGELWGLHNTGQTTGTPDADVDAPEAWDITTGESPVVLGSLSGVSLAVLDTGVDYIHPDIAANIRRDQAGAIVGYDFVNTDADPMDDNNHGTHMAGTIAASGHNGVGVTGVAWRARLMPVKVLNAAGVGTDSQAIAGIDYARTNGARILCAAWGGRAHSQLLLEAIQRARDADILLVAPAGNNGTDNDQEPYFPAGYQSQTSNMIVVASTDHNDQLAPDSQFGLTSVDLGAPGVNLLSTTRGNTYSVMSGTSVAASYVAGAAALVLARYSSTSVAALKLRLLSSVDRKPGLAGRVRTGGRLNLFGGLENDVTAPGAPTEFRAIERTSSGLCLVWRAAGDDGTNGVAGMYELRYSPAPITSVNFAQAAPAYNLPAPAANGTQQSYGLSGLEPGGTYYVALRSLDNVGNAS